MLQCRIRTTTWVKRAKILNELDKIGPCKMSDLSDALVVTMGGLTPHVDKLVEKGLVRRSETKKETGDWFW